MEQNKLLDIINFYHSKHGHETLNSTIPEILDANKKIYENSLKEIEKLRHFIQRIDRSPELLEDKDSLLRETIKVKYEEAKKTVKKAEKIIAGGTRKRRE